MTSERDVPRYQQIFFILREKILTGQFPSGARLPSEAKLAREFDVSRITTQRAMNELARAGLVTRERGRGTLVRENVIRGPGIDETSAHLSMTDRFIGQSRIIGQSDIQLLAFVRQPAPPHVIEKLALEPGSDVYFIERIRSSDGTPFCHVEAYVPVDIGRTFSPAALESSMLIDLIAETGHRIGNAEQIVTATVADTVVANHLDVAPGAPNLFVARTVYDTEGTPIEHAEASFRPDRFRLSMSLEGNAQTSTPAIASGA